MLPYEYVNRQLKDCTLPENFWDLFRKYYNSGALCFESPYMPDFFKAMKTHHPEIQLVADLGDKRIFEVFTDFIANIDFNELEKFLYEDIDGFTESKNVRKTAIIAAVIKLGREQAEDCDLSPSLQRDRIEKFFLLILSRNLLSPKDMGLCIKYLRKDENEKLSRLIPMMVLHECGELDTTKFYIDLLRNTVGKLDMKIGG